MVIWERLARDLPKSALQRTMKVIPLTEARAMADEILGAHTVGHIVVDVNA